MTDPPVMSPTTGISPEARVKTIVQLLDSHLGRPSLAPSDAFQGQIEQLEIAKRRQDLDESRRHGRHVRLTSWLIFAFFCVVNLAVIFLVFHIFDAEHAQPPARPVLTATVLQMLVGATIVQLGGLAFGIGRRLFK